MTKHDAAGVLLHAAMIAARNSEYDEAITAARQAIDFLTMLARAQKMGDQQPDDHLWSRRPDAYDEAEV